MIQVQFLKEVAEKRIIHSNGVSELIPDTNEIVILEVDCDDIATAFDIAVENGADPYKYIKFEIHE